MRWSVGIVGGGVRVGRACTLMAAIPAPGRILLVPNVRAPYLSVDYFKLVWSVLTDTQSKLVYPGRVF
jgi:hypothetical protein